MSALLHIGPARSRDAPACARILSDWTGEAGWLAHRHNQAQDGDYLARMIERGWVSVLRGAGADGDAEGEGDGAVAGFLARDGAEIHALYVARRYRCRGFGRALLDAAKLARPVLRLWTFQANLRAQAFYRREGFVEILRSDGAGNDAGLPDIRYEWKR